ncbi:MAG: methionyl-tRNA formyltransferase [Pseudomonadota bacterium]|nr:methionyl-tRNA formyltransferase [Pseudomonadota bacterium]
MKIIFIATGKFGAQVLKKLAQTEYKPDFLICALDKPTGRKYTLSPCPAKEIAQKKKIKVLSFKTLKDKDAFRKIQEIQPDLIIVADTNFILPQKILDIPKYKCLNVHPSLLPKFRGPSPIKSAILWGEKKTGVSLIQMDEKIDHGPIIAKKEMPIADRNTYLTLRDKLAQLGARLLIEILPQWTSFKIKPLAQKDGKAIYTKKFKKEDGLIDWKKSAQEIEQKIRALNPWPGTYTFFNHQDRKKRLKILAAQVIDVKINNLEEGKIKKVANKKMGVLCGKGTLILSKIQIEGKKEMTGEAFLNGYKNVKKLTA